MLTVLPGDNPTQIYTPFPDYEKEVPGGANPTVTQRVTFSANGRAMAQWVKVGATATLYALYTDHLGSVVAIGTAGGGLVANSYATYQPFGAFVSNPTGTNPSVTDRGFTGHKHNNTGTNNLGLIYMNARYYHPQLGRFVSPDTIVPEPGEPQSYNRYVYGYNNPVKYVDQDGHCPRPAESTSPVICMALFIEPATVQAGPFTVHGDGRGFEIDSDPSASRGYIWIDVASGEWETHMNPSGYIFQGNLLSPGPDSIAYFDPSASNNWDVAVNDEGVITVSYDLVLSGPLEWSRTAPHINGVVQFTPNADGSIDFAFERDGFPWAEAYLYTGDQTEIIFQDAAVRGHPYDLFGIEPTITAPASIVRWGQRLLHGEPQVSMWDGTWNGLYKPE